MACMSPDAAVARLASRQEGNITTAQLLGEGLSATEIRGRVRCGALLRRHRGVYAVGHVPEGWFSAAFAAWLAYGRTSALSHITCAAALETLPPPGGLLHLTRATRGHVHRGTRLHRVDLGRDTWRRRGLIVTSPARMLLDLASSVPPNVVERAYNQAQVLKLLTPAQLGDRLDEWQGRRGVALLRSFIDDRGATRSELEDAFRAVVRGARLGRPDFNVWVDGVFADAVWHDARVVVELDGRAFHGHDAAFEGDRTKGNRLALKGWTVLRFTYRRIKREPLAVVAELTAALTRRRAA